MVNPLGIQAVLAGIMAGISRDHDDASRSLFPWLWGISVIGLMSHVFYPDVALVGFVTFIGTGMGLFIYYHQHAHVHG